VKGHVVINSSELERRRERAGRNQSLFREVNERIEDLSLSAAFTSFVCECDDDACDETLPLTLEEYEDVRSDSNRFFVAPGHQVPEVEDVVAATDRYLVVAKLGAGREVAVESDPRRREV
jgi:hypothetical protein